MEPLPDQLIISDTCKAIFITIASEGSDNRFKMPNALIYQQL